MEITEKDFASQVETLLKVFHWHWCHFRPAKTEHGWRTALSGHQGLPDYIAARPPRLILFELKSEKGKVSPEQQEWLDILKLCNKGYKSVGYSDSVGVEHWQVIPEVYLWRPSHIEVIVQCLR